MEFNPGMGELLYCGKSKRGRAYTVNGRMLRNADEEKDFGV